FFVEELLAEGVRHLDQFPGKGLCLAGTGSRLKANKPHNRFWQSYGLLRFRRQWCRLILKRRDDAKLLLRPVVVFVQIAANTAPERNRVRGNQTVVDDLSLERQKHNIRQDRQAGADDFLDWIGQTENSVGFIGFVGGTEEDRVLLQVAENVESANQGMFPTGGNLQFLWR